MWPNYMQTFKTWTTVVLLIGMLVANTSDSKRHRRFQNQVYSTSVHSGYV